MSTKRPYEGDRRERRPLDDDHDAAEGSGGGGGGGGRGGGRGGGGAGADAQRRAAEREHAKAVESARRERVNAQVGNMDEASCLAYLAEMSLRWQVDFPNTTFDSLIELAFKNFGEAIGATLNTMDIGSFGIRALDDRIADAECEGIAMYHRLRTLKLLEDANNLNRILKVLELIYYAKKIVLSTMQASLALYTTNYDDMKLSEDLDARLGSWSLRFRWIDPAETNQVQRLLLHLLDMAFAKGYRKQDGFVFRPVITSEGHNTRAWEMIGDPGDIREFVYSCCSKDTAWESWINLTHSNSNSRAVIDYLTSCQDYQFPDLVKQRTVFAFRNGVYDAAHDTFHRFTSEDPLPDSVVACKYFDQELDDYRCLPWQSIPTPYFESIMKYQSFEDPVCEWMYIFIGRLIYNVGEKDGWQVIPFLQGMAGSGKSTISLKIAKQLYQSIDVGILSNNIEKKFGISSLASKYIFVAPEIKSDLQIEQAEFQSIVSGEDIQVNTKYKKAYSTQWTVPGLLAGNEVPTWTDNSSSIQRRVVLFDFKKAVTTGADMKLGDRLAEEMGAILVKCNRAYLEASQKWGHLNIWSVLPPYFQATRNTLAAAVNGLEAYLTSGEVVLGPEEFMPYKEFTECLRAYEQANNFKSKTYNDAFFEGPFSRHGISQLKDNRQYNGRMRNNTQWVVGVALAPMGNGGGEVTEF